MHELPAVCSLPWYLILGQLQGIGGPDVCDLPSFLESILEQSVFDRLREAFRAWQSGSLWSSVGLSVTYRACEI